MGPAIVADDPAAVHREDHRKVLHGDVVDDLIEAALQKSGIDRDDRHDPLGREPGRERDGVLLADANVEKTLRKLFEEREQAGAAGHRSGDRDRALVRLQDLADRICEHRRVLRGRRFGGAARRNPVPLHVVVLGGTVAVALLGLDVDEDRAVTEIAGFLEHALYREEVVTIDRPKVREAELLEEDVGDEERLQAREDPAAGLLGQLAAGHVLEDLPSDVFIASKAMPAVSAPSPMMATTWLSSPLRSRATAIPCAAEMEVPACPAPNWS